MPTVVKRKKASNAPKAPPGEPAWDIDFPYPKPGHWTEEQYFALEAISGNRMIELSDGCLEILPMPDMFHQDIVEFIFRQVEAFVKANRLGRIYFSPLPVRLFSGKIREPDIMYFEARRILDADKRPLDGADLVMEVPSRGKKNRERDLETKRKEYAKAKIPEYWIVDPQEETITVLTLSAKSYKVHGVFQRGDVATSKLLKGFEVAVRDVFAAGEGKS